MAATTLWQRDGGPIDVGFFASLYSRTFDRIVKKNEAEPAEGAQFFGNETTNRNEFKIGEMSSVLDVPMVNSDSAKVPMVSPLEGYPKTFTPVQRRSGFIVTRESIEKQKTRMIQSCLNGLPASFKSLRELAIASFLANSHSTETGSDGSAVFALIHNLEDPKFGTWSNLAASAGGVTTASLFDAWSNLQGRVNAKGRPTPDVPADLAYHYSKHEAVMKVLGSNLYPQNALNAKLPAFIKAVTPMPLHWVTDSDMWFVRGRKDKSDPGFKIVVNAKETYVPISDSLNPDLIMGKRGRVSFAIGAVHGRGWYSNAGA